MNELEQIKKQIEELNNKVKELEKKENKKWKPKKDELYYYHLSKFDDIFSECWEDDLFGKRNFIIGNYFKTYEEAEQNKDKVIKNLEKLELQKELQDYADEVNEGWEPDWDNEDEYKYHIFYNYEKKYFDVYYDFSRKGLSEVIFQTEESACEAIESFGDRLKLLIED